VSTRKKEEECACVFVCLRICECACALHVAYVAAFEMSADVMNVEINAFEKRHAEEKTHLSTSIWTRFGLSVLLLSIFPTASTACFSLTVENAQLY